MGNIIKWFKNLEIFVKNRRENVYAVHRSALDHPERLPLENLTTSKNIEHKPKSLSIPITATTEPITIATTTTTNTEVSSNKCSDFYLACRSNNIEEVKRLIQILELDELDRIQPNGSTALHAACYHGHQEIVKLLLEAGADRAIPNKFNCLPFDEAKYDGIKELFFRIPNSNRYVSRTGAIEWDLIDEDVSETAAEERQNIKTLYDNVTGTTPLAKMFEKIQKNYVDKGLNNFTGIDKIRRFFQKATEEQDPIWIIKAYTAETDFYKILNQEIAGGATKYQNERRYIIALLAYHPKLDRLSYTGTSYRVMQMNPTDVKKYQVNCSLMTKSFLSSSIEEKIAAWFLCRQELALKESDQAERLNADGKLIKQWVMCIYNIKHRRSALYIENSSQYANEGEILILPYSVFQVKQIQRVKVRYSPEERYITEIHLEEIDEYLNT